MSRREWVQRLAAALAGGAVAPAAASAHPVYKHLSSEATMALADSRAGELHWQPAFFDPYQGAAFTVLAERILPGSSEAQVSRFVDLLLSVDTLENQKRFVNSLSAFDAYANAKYGHPFKDLTEEQQNELLTIASTTKPAREPRASLRARRARAEQEEAQIPLTFGDHFENLKLWVSGAYFSSESGMKSMGWTGQVMWPDFPGCKDAPH